MIPETLIKAFRDVHHHGHRGFCVVWMAVLLDLTAVFLLGFSMGPDAWLPALSDDMRISIENLSSICEVAIGVNVALSLVDSMTAHIVKQHSDYVEQFDIQKNATFAEAVYSVTESLAADTGLGLTAETFTKHFTAQLEKEFNEFVKACKALTTVAKAMGGVVAIQFYGFLCLITLYPAIQVPIVIAALVCLAGLLPLAMHVLGTWAFSKRFVRDVELFRNDQPHLQMVAPWSRKVMEVYREKKKKLGAPDAAVVNAQELERRRTRSFVGLGGTLAMGILLWYITR